MPKKKLNKKRGRHYELKLTVAIFTSFLLILGVTVFLNIKTKTFCANSVSCINDLSGKPTADKTGVFMGQKVTIPQLPTQPQFVLDNLKNVLGSTTYIGNGEKHIFVNLTNQHLYAYQGGTLIYNFLISSGKWHPTPIGDFHIWVWLRYTTMIGGDPAKGTYYDLPNVPYTMYISNASVPGSEGYSLHGAYWHNNFGHPMSHGCINISPKNAAVLFYWTNPTAGYVTYPTSANPGTLVTIYGAPPANETEFID